MKNKNDIREALCTRLKSTQAQSARLYGLAKMHKQSTPLRPVLSLPGSSYDHLNKTLANYFDKIEGQTKKPTLNWPGRSWRKHNWNLMTV